MTYEQFLRRLPKAELHIHYIGAVRRKTFFELAHKNGVKLPTHDPEQVYAYDNIVDFLKIFDLVGLSIVERDDFARVAYESLEDGVKLGNLRYREMFFNPTSHTLNGIEFDTVVDGILDGVRAAEKDFGVRCKLIAAIHRGHPPAAAQVMVEQVVASRREEIIGVGSDARHPEAGPDSEGLHFFHEAYAYAKKHGLRICAHAAESPGKSASFGYALDVLQCDRIDHGYCVLDDPALVERAKREGVWFTCCPCSTAWVYGYGGADLSTHPIRDMVEQGLNVTLNSDDPPMFKTDIGNEFVKACPAMGFSPDVAIQLALNGIEASWLDEGEKRQRRREFEREIAALKSELEGSASKVGSVQCEAR